jgi:hypothetical protein
MALTTTSISSVRETLNLHLGELYTWSGKGEYQRIRTPYLYPDGDIDETKVEEI